MTPVVISGSGGSGTRVVAQALGELGYWLGPDLNESLDDLTWTFLFKHPLRYAVPAGRSALLQQEIQKRYQVHRSRFIKGSPRPPAAVREILHAAYCHGRNRYGWRWVFARLRRTVRPAEAQDRWGFKEPHILFFLPELIESYPQLRYVHLLRNGLDMAYTDHDQDFVGWSAVYGLDADDRSARNRFEFWARVNRQALDLAGQRLNEDRLLVLRLEDLCGDPQRWMSVLAEFVGIDGKSINRRLFELPRLPRSHERYLTHDQSWIDAAVESTLLDLGYRGAWPADSAGSRS